MNRKRINPTRSEGQDGDVWERLLADIRGHIYGFTGTYKELADKAGLCEATVSKFAYAETNSPHMRTVMKIMTALDKEQAVLTAFKSEAPITKSAAVLKKTVRRKISARARGREKFSFTRASTKRSNVA